MNISYVNMHLHKIPLIIIMWAAARITQITLLERPDAQTSWPLSSTCCCSVWQPQLVVDVPSDQSALHTLKKVPTQQRKLRFTYFMATTHYCCFQSLLKDYYCS